MYFFGSKDGLFAAALRDSQPVLDLVGLADEADRDSLGERLTRGYLALWEAPETRGLMLAVVRATFASQSAADMVTAFMAGEVMLPLATRINADQAELRANLTGAHLLGTATARYVLRVEPLASLGPESVVAHVAPVVQHLLTGPLGVVPASP